MKNNLTKTIAFGAVAIALSVSLNFVKFKIFPTGGSVTLLRMLPLVIYAYMFGMPWGFFMGAMFGVIDCWIDPYIIHPIQYLLDYPLQFAMAGLAGMFRNTKSGNKILFGTLLVAAGRILCCFASGLIFFTDFAEMSVAAGVWYSLSYQLITIGPDMLLVVLAVFVLERNKAFMNYADGIKSDRKKTEENEKL